MKKVCFETFGCRLNRAEALAEEARYLADGWKVTHHHSEADLIIIRGCSVTGRAAHDCEKLFNHLQRHYPETAIRICGCIKAEDRVPPSKKLLMAAPPPEPTPAPLPMRTARAYLKVQDGCPGHCTFCIVPKFRGKESRSVPFTEVLGLARRYLEAGYRELVVTGCNLTLYASEGKRLPELASALANLDTDAPYRVRLGSIEPGAIARELVCVIAANPRLCRTLHLSIQSGSSQMLAAMGRKYTAKEMEGLLQQINDQLPLLGIGCDLIVGFPGETEIDFRSTVGLLNRHEFSKIHVFPYSERPGTIAAGLSGAIPKDLRQQRAHEIAQLAQHSANRFRQRFLGRPVEVLIEDELHQAGWTSEYLWFQREAKHFHDPVHRRQLGTFIVRKDNDGILLG